MEKQFLSHALQHPDLHSDLSNTVALGVQCHIDLTLGLLVVGQQSPCLWHMGSFTTHPAYAWPWKLGGFESK